MDENQRRIMPKKITKKQIYNLKILQDLFKTCNDWKLEEIAKYSFLHINTINKLYDYYLANKPVSINPKTIERLEDFLEENSFLIKMECKNFQQQKKIEKTKYNYIIANKDFELLGIKVNDMTFDSETLLFTLQKGVCRCHLDKIYLAIQDENYKKRLENALVFKKRI